MGHLSPWMCAEMTILPTSYGIVIFVRHRLLIFPSLCSTFFLFVMCKLPPFPKDLILHHHGEGEILPKLLQEHHEGLAFSLGKFLVYFCLLLFF